MKHPAFRPRHAIALPIGHRAHLFSLAKIAAALVLTILVLPSGAAAQEELLGNWKIDVARSDPPQRGGNVIDNHMEIFSAGDDLRVERVYVVDGQEHPVTTLYVTDGKPHDIPNPRGGTNRARAKIKKGRLSVSYTTSFNTPRGPLDLDITEVWRRKGEELEISYAVRVNERVQQRKEIYVASE